MLPAIRSMRKVVWSIQYTSVLFFEGPQSINLSVGYKLSLVKNNWPESLSSLLASNSWLSIISEKNWIVYLRHPCVLPFTFTANIWRLVKGWRKKKAKIRKMQRKKNYCRSFDLKQGSGWQQLGCSECLFTLFSLIMTHRAL